MVVDSGPLHPLAMCCHNAFWDMIRVEVGKLAALKGIQMPQGATLFSTLFTAIIGILDVDENRAMDYVGNDYRRPGMINIMARSSPDLTQRSRALIPMIARTSKMK